MPTVKKGLCAALLMLMAVFCCLPAPAEETQTLPPNMRVVNCRQDVSLREKPSTSARIVDSLASGRRLIVSGEPDDEGWVSVHTAEYSGYVKLEYLARE